jgi:uncharacterized membrane protein
MADAQRLQALLNGQNPSTPQSSPSITHTVTLSEKVGLNDVSGKNGAQKSESASQNFPSINFANFDIKNILYPVISLVGVGIVIVVLYFKKKQKNSNTVSPIQTSAIHSIEPASEEEDGDYAMTILKNRLAKGEITIDEYKTLKDELSEP